MTSGNDVFCSGLFLSARWFALSEAASPGINLVVLPDRDSAEYCSADLYSLVEGDRVFYLPVSGKSVERSNHIGYPQPHVMETQASSLVYFKLALIS